MSETPRPTRILVAEDDPALRRLIDMLLTNQGFEVHAVSDGADALALVDEWEPDACVVDVMMPRISGLTVCRELRANPRHAAVPIIILTARVFDEDIQEVVDLGGIEFMSKPFNPRQLMAALERLVAGSGAETTPEGARPMAWTQAGTDPAR
jgi:two-component system alkaline phosphatase synthesis response regulator PhoP